MKARESPGKVQRSTPNWVWKNLAGAFRGKRTGTRGLAVLFGSCGRGEVRLDSRGNSLSVLKREPGHARRTHINFIYTMRGAKMRCAIEFNPGVGQTVAKRKERIRRSIHKLI